MSPELMIAIGGVLLIVLIVGAVTTKLVVRRAPLRQKRKGNQQKWRELQQFCKDKTTWPNAIVAADTLLDKALIRRGFKGKSTGERLVSAQRSFTDNDALWFAHKLCKKIQDDPQLKLKERDVKNALIGFRQALKDIGAL